MLAVMSLVKITIFLMSGKKIILNKVHFLTHFYHLKELLNFVSVENQFCKHFQCLQLKVSMELLLINLVSEGFSHIFSLEKT